MSDTDPYTETRAELLAAMLPEVAFDGWTPKALQAAIAAAALDANMVTLAFPKGVDDVLRYYSAAGDQRMLAQLGAPDDMKIRERVRQGVVQRLGVDGEEREAARRAATYLSVPGRQKLAAELLFETANQIWRWAGDTATDYNYYSKRLILSGVLASTRLVWLDDDTPEGAKTWAFLDRRIDNVMQFEKVKAGMRQRTQAWQSDDNPLMTALGKLASLRYRDGAASVFSDK